MSLVEEAFDKLFPGREFEYSAKLKYSRKFSPYNAGVRKTGNLIEFRLSHCWREVDEQIKIGLLQDLLLKILNKKASTLNIDLYNSFVRNLYLSAPKTESDPALLDSFNRVNDEYFYGSVDQPNLRWGSDSTSKLASYNYQTDTITISTVFRNSRQELVDYLMYHELLHKKLKFYSKNNKNFHHTRKFRASEKEFKNHALLEKELQQAARRRRFFGFLKL